MTEKEDRPEQDEHKKEEKRFLPVVLVFELGILIAAPIVLLGVLGRIIDKELDASPFFLIFAIVLSLLISGFLVYRKVRDVID